jgi:Lrp/AsnC family transcriptional regulator, leucine-responsive regulatory protein
MGTMEEQHEKLLDAIGRKILSELQLNARIPFAELGRRVGLSTPAVMDRVRKLEEVGIIEGYKAVINTTRLGYPILAFIGVNVPGDVITRFTTQVRRIARVIECHRVTGSHSFLLKVLATSVTELEQVIDMLTPYTETTTYLVLSTAFSTKAIDSKDDVLEGALPKSSKGSRLRGQTRIK